MDHGCQPPRTFQARHSCRLWFVFTVSVACVVVGSRGASYGTYENDGGVTRERRADRARRPAIESRSSLSEVTRETYERARTVFEEFLNERSAQCGRASTETRTHFGAPVETPPYPGGPPPGTGAVLTEMVRAAAAAWHRNMSYVMRGKWALVSDSDCAEAEFQGFACMFPGLSRSCRALEGENPMLNLQDAQDFWRHWSKKLSVDAIFLFGLAADALTDVRRASVKVKSFLEHDLSSALAGSESEGIAVGIHFRNRGDIRLDGRLRIPLERYVEWVDGLGNSTKIRAVYVATDHDGLDVRELNERFPGRSYEFRMIKRLWAPATATNLWQTTTTATAGGLKFETAKTQMVVEALSDINILSHCDAFLGSISNFLPFIMSLLHARDSLRERGRICGLMNTNVTTFGGHAAAEELTKATSEFASGLDDAHAGDVGSKEAIVSCVGDRSLRDYWMVLYGHNIPSETVDVLPLR